MRQKALEGSGNSYSLDVTVPTDSEAVYKNDLQWRELLDNWFATREEGKPRSIADALFECHLIGKTLGYECPYCKR
jgi:hypothetical protein